jgi:hypothetical protein
LTVNGQLLTQSLGPKIRWQSCAIAVDFYCLFLLTFFVLSLMAVIEDHLDHIIFECPIRKLGFPFSIRFASLDPLDLKQAIAF